MDIPWGQVAATPPLRRGYSVETSSGNAAANHRYYALCHFLEEKAREDKLWIEKGYTLIPIANHLEHGFALPLAVIDALFGGHAGETTFADTRLFVVGYIIFYLILILVNKKLTHEWVYPIFGVAEEKLGQPVGFLVLIVPIVLVYLSLAVLGQRLAG